jgi:carboxymethylenebutenolidase
LKCFLEALFVRSKPAVALGLLSLSSLCLAALPTTQTGTYKVGDETIQVYVARTTSTSVVPGIVLLHEMWGLNEQIMGVADRLAQLGYVVVAPDMFKGKLAPDLGLAQDMTRALKDERGVASAKGAVDLLRRMDRASGRPVALVGFGVGGRIALLAALKGVDVRSTVMFYGTFPGREELKPLQASLMGIFAAKDISIPVETVKTFEATLKETGKDAKIIVFDGTGHDFFNESRSDYEPEIAKDAWVRMRDWLALKLKDMAPDPVRPPPVPATPSSTP